MPQRNVVITGAGGIGTETARLFLASGEKVILIEHPSQATRAAKTAEKLSEETKNPICIPFLCDMTKQEFVSQAFERLGEEFGSIQVLVNTAGIMPPVRPFAKMGWEELEESLETILSVNLKGTIYATHAVLPMMQKQNYGRIVNCASIAAFGGDAGTFYAVSKAAVARFTSRVAIEAVRRKDGEPYNIRINAVAPGIIKTPMTDDVPDKFMIPYYSRTPIRRKGTPNEVARWIHFLASDGNTLCLGQTITLDGGWSIA